MKKESVTPTIGNLLVMWYYCVLEESDRFFQTSPCTIMIQNESVKRFFRTRRSEVLKNLFGRVLNHIMVQGRV